MEILDAQSLKINKLFYIWLRNHYAMNVSKILFILTTFLLVVNSFAQQPNEKYIGVSTSLDLPLYDLESGYGFGTGINSISQLHYGYSVGMFAYFQRTKHSAFQIGLNFKDIVSQVNVMMNPMIDVSASSFPFNENYVSHSRLIEIPVIGYLNFGKGKLKFNTGFGLKALFILNRYDISDITYADGTTTKGSFFINKIAGEQRFNVNPQISFGVSYQFNSKNIVRIEATDNIYLNYLGARFLNFTINDLNMVSGLNISLLRKF